MEEAFISSIVEPVRGELASSEASRLRETVQNLEAECDQHSRKQHVDDTIRVLHIRLVDESLRMRNVQLCLLALKKLDLHDLMSVVDAAESTESMFGYVANYLQLDTTTADMEQDEANHQDTTRLASKWHNELDESLQSIGVSYAQREEMLREIATGELAKDHEIDESFSEALTLHEKAGTYYEHLPRVTMKHLMFSAHYVLQEYCSRRHLLQNSWFEYLIACRRYGAAAKFCESAGDKISGLRSCSLAGLWADKQEEELASLLPKQMLEFFLASEPSKWAAKKKLELVASIGMSLGLETRRLLAEHVAHHLRYDNIPLAMCLAFCLNKADVVLDQYMASVDRALCLDSFNGHELPYHLTAQCTNHLMSCIRVDKHLNEELINSAALRLGLLDEVLQLQLQSGRMSSNSLAAIRERLEWALEDGLSDRLKYVDPVIGRSTQIALLQALRVEADDKDQTMSVINIMIVAINIVLVKLDTSAGRPGGEGSISALERMFESLAKCLDELAFSASDGLVRATNSLVVAIKSKLDTLAESENIRESFKGLIGAMAGRCLIEARYKSAAILYSQIEDNVNAIKSLMRTGEVDTVIDYALLVRDITVNRIAINYLKHLRVEPEIIEDFIARCKL